MYTQKSEIRDDRFYISIVRGTRDRHEQFNPAGYDFGDPDVLPRDIIDDDRVAILARHGGEVSFDRFGRRPTYLSFRFSLSETPSGPADETTAGEGVAGLRILAIDDQQVAFLLFDTAKAWLQKNGYEAMTGPINFGENDTNWGCLVHGFVPQALGK